jgi:hypothetical protein
MGGESEGVARGQRNRKSETGFIATDDLGRDFVSAHAEVLPDRAFLLSGSAVFINIEAVGGSAEPVDESK